MHRLPGNAENLDRLGLLHPSLQSPDHPTSKIFLGLGGQLACIKLGHDVYYTKNQDRCKLFYALISNYDNAWRILYILFAGALTVYYIYLTQLLFLKEDKVYGINFIKLKPIDVCNIAVVWPIRYYISNKSYQTFKEDWRHMFVLVKLSKNTTLTKYNIWPILHDDDLKVIYKVLSMKTTSDLNK